MDYADLKEKFTKLLKQAGVKPQSKQAGLLEFGFLQGYIFANPEANSHPYLLILMMSGRSILDD